MESLKPVYVFGVILRQGSMSAAAAQLRMTPSAVSQVVRKLERHYGVKLLARTTRSLTATKGGACRSTQSSFSTGMMPSSETWAS